MTGLNRLAAIQLTLVVAALGVVGAEPEPMEILRRSILARTSVDFSGIRTVVVFSDGEKTRGVQQKVDCDAPDHLRIIVVAPESEHGKLCLTAHQDHWEYDPHTGRAVHTKMPEPGKMVQTRLAELERIADQMRIRYVGKESIAGRGSHVVKVFTAEGLPVKKVWVDDRHYVTLKTLRFDSHGTVKSSVYYTRIDFSPLFTPGLFEFTPPDDARVVEADHARSHMSLEQAQKKAGFEAVLPSYLPPGYHFQRDRTSVIEVGGGPTIWLSFSNGADTFSLFQRMASAGDGSDKHDRYVTWEDDGYRFTLMGTLAADEAKKVRESVTP